MRPEPLRARMPLRDLSCLLTVHSLLLLRRSPSCRRAPFSLCRPRHHRHPPISQMSWYVCHHARCIKVRAHALPPWRRLPLPTPCIRRLRLNPGKEVVSLQMRGSVCEQMRKQCVLRPADRCASPLHAQCAGSLKAHASPRASESGRPHQSEVQGGSRDHTTLPSTAHMTTPSPPDTPTPPDGVFECQGFAWRSVRATEARTGVYGRRTQQRRNPPHHSVALPSAHDTAPAQTPRGFGAPPHTTAHHDPRVAVRTQPWVSVALPR